MTQAIWKFPIPAEPRFSLEMPAGAQLLRFDLQYDPRHDGENVVLWALVEIDPLTPTRRRTFCCVPTGDTFDFALTKEMYVVSILLNRGQLVFHLFDLGEEK